MERDRTESSAAINTTSITAAGDDTADIVSGDGGPILPGGGVLTATEVECNIPGCAPIETVVAFYSAAEDAPNFAAKILKPIADVTREEAAEAVADLRAQAQDFLEQQIKPQQGEMGEVRGIGERKKAGGGEQTGQVLDEKEEHQQQGQQQQRQEQEETKEDNSIEKVRRTSGGETMEEIAAVLSAPEVPVPTAVTESASFSADDNGIFTFLFRLAAMGGLSSRLSPLLWQQRQRQLRRPLSWQGGKAVRSFLGGVLGGVVGGTVGAAIAGAAVSALSAGKTLTLQGKSASIGRSLSPPPSPLL